jgi:molybdenum cofactor cytidylyltransferase
MGAPKQLLAYRGKTLLQHAIDTATSLTVAPVVVVVGAHAAQIRAQLSEARVLAVENRDWRDGMGGSVRTGLNTALAAHPEISAAIFLTCDQPLLSATALGNLIAAHQQNSHAIVASEYNGTLGVPALFPREFFPELLALAGASGARQIIHAHRDRVVGVPFPDGAVDIDTPADYLSLRELSTPTLV